MPRVEVLGETFDAIGLDEAVEWVMGAMRAKRAAVICTVNVATMLRARRDPRLRDFIRRSDLVVADGQPIVWAARLLGGRLPQRIGGVDLAERLLSRCEEEGLGVYFLGAEERVVEEAARRARARHPRLDLSSSDGYFDDDDASTRAQAVGNQGARLVLVGMGVPRQEYFIDSHRGSLGSSVAIGVGGTFDVMSGKLWRAPVLLQRAGLEWLVRLVQEPRRLLWRYLESNTWFVLAVMWEMIRRLFSRSGVLLPLLLSASSCS